jgi:hypothetical protein
MGAVAFFGFLKSFGCFAVKESRVFLLTTFLFKVHAFLFIKNILEFPKNTWGHSIGLVIGVIWLFFNSASIFFPVGGDETVFACSSVHSG